MKLIKELVSQFKEHQRKQVEQMPRIYFEYTTLEADNKYPDFEVHVIKGQQVRVTTDIDRSRSHVQCTRNVYLTIIKYFNNLYFIQFILHFTEK